MPTTKIAISIDKLLVQKIDQLVYKHIFPNRSKAIQQAVEEKINRFDKIRLARECSKLNTDFEQSLAEEGLKEDFEEWPEY
jgi:metal-responsive CopG/Arc/MetJ family transcriptional regulator